MFQLSPLTAPGSRRGSIVTVSVLVAALLALGVQHAPPAHAAVVGKFGPAVVAIGSGVTIGGEGLTDVTAVTFQGTPVVTDDVVAEHFIVLDAKKMVVQVPAGAVTGPVAVTAGGVTTASAVALTIVHPPVLGALSATSGAPGTTFTINGQNLMGSKKPKVLIGGKGASPVTMSQTAVEVKIPGLPGGPHELKVITDGGVAKGTFYIAPTVKKASPGFGTTAGGNVITVSGTGFTGVDNFVDDPATAAVNEKFNGVKIGGVNVTQLIAVNDKEVVVRTPAGVDPAAPIVVSTTDGSVVAASSVTAPFAYRPLPAVTSVSPDWNAVGSPAPVTVTGQNLTETTAVLLNGVAVTAKTVNLAAGTVTFTPDPASVVKAGVAKLSFTNTEAGVAYPLVVPFNVVTTPIVTKLVPATGAAGKTVSVAGSGFASGTTVTFGGVAATCKVVSYALITCTAPSGVPNGAAPVIVTNGVGASDGVASFTYDAAGSSTDPPSKLAPAVGGLVPAYGTTGSTVALKGGNLHSVTRVQFTGPDNTWVNAPDYLSVAPGRLVVKVPAGAVSGQLRVTNPDGVVLSDAKVLYRTVPPSVTALDVVGDQTYGVTPNDFLTIRGNGLFIKGAKTFVTIGGVAAPILARPRPTPRSITVKVPAALGGREEVVVSTPLGTAKAETSVYYLPEIKGGKPLTTSRTGGTVVTIGGMGFNGVDNVTVGAGRLSAVRFGGTPVAAMVVMSDKTVVVKTAAGSASADDLVVRTQHDGRVGDSEGDVRALSVPGPSVSSITPSSARVGAVPASATITGTNFSANSTVAFGGVPATVQSVASDGLSMVVAPPTGTTTGSVNVTVTNTVDGDGLSATLAAGYTYTMAAATVASISPQTAPAGTRITILGTGFTSGSSVTFGTVPATAVTVANTSTIFATVPLTPSLARGTTVAVTVVNSTGEASTPDTATADDWTWNGHAVITGMATSAGTTGTCTGCSATTTVPAGTEGSTVTLTGTSFTGATAVRFGTIAATYTVVNDTTITATVPVSPVRSATADISVVGADGAVQAPLNPAVNDWTWSPVAEVTSLTSGVAAGAPMTIYGTNMAGARQVVFDLGTQGILTAVPTANTATSVTVTVPPRPGGAVRAERPVYVITGSGARSTTATQGANSFTWG